MKFTECNPYDLDEDRALWKSKLQIPDGLDMRPIPPTDLRRRLGLQGSDLEEVYRSSLKNQWFDCDNGNFLLEIPSNERLRNKLGNPSDTNKSELVWLFDLDDTLLNTTAWHDKEQKIIRSYLNKQHVVSSEAGINAIYEISKVLIPNVAEVQARYTPLLNMILIDQYIRRQKHDGLSASDALVCCRVERNYIQDLINVIGEGVLQDYKYDQSLLAKILHENSTNRYINAPLIKDLFTVGKDSNDNVLRIIITRGKIEGPLGQIYKVHNGDFTKLESLDMVIYTNDVKINALARVTNIFKELRSKQIILYDDNPSEIVPFLEQIEAQGMNSFKMEIVHVRHSDAKRRDKKVVISSHDSEQVVDPENSLGYAYTRSGKKAIPIESFKEIPPNHSGTIFDFFSLNDKGMSQVV